MANKRNLKSWKPGQSGNPGGRPKVAPEVREMAKQKSKEAFERICQIIADDDSRVALAACNVVLERAYGRPATERPTVSVDLPEIDNPESLMQAMSKILFAVGNGDIAPADAREVASLIETHRKIIETTELEQRVLALEEKAK